MQFHSTHSESKYRVIDSWKTEIFLWNWGRPSFCSSNNYRWNNFACMSISQNHILQEPHSKAELYVRNHSHYVKTNSLLW